MAVLEKTGHRIRLVRLGAAAAIVAVAAIGYAVLAPSRVATAPTQPPVPVAIAAVTQQPMPVRIETIGTVQTIANVVVKSRVDGYITDVLIKDGQFVKTGEIMFKLDDRAARAQLEQMKAQLENAKRDVARYKPLVSQQFVSRQVYDTAVANEQALQAQVDDLQAQLSYYTIVAPIDGRAGTINIKAGNSIKANDLPFVTINQISPIYVGFTLPQSELPGLRDAMAKGPVTVQAKPNGDDGPAIAGKLAFFDNSVDVNSGTIAAKAVFENSQQRLWPGQFVNVSVTERVDPDALTVPAAAVLVGQNTSYVYVIKDGGIAHMQPVTVARTIDGVSVISAGLTAGERVATDGQLRLTDGSKVEIRSPGVKPDSQS
ncbi:MAG: efflux RND transporter periplasmic adaptor subunit [Alphaproteobacteria bacterium]|nr:efflux RND transporter periplasmic adaptor subunit [Alphaproteobacteria bacterium]